MSEKGFLHKWSEVLVGCIAKFCVGSCEDSALDSLVGFVNECFSASLCSKNTNVGCPDSSLLVCGEESSFQLIVKKRPSVSAVFARRQVLLFFEVLVFFLGVFVDRKSVSVIGGEEESSFVVSRCEDLKKTYGSVKVLQGSFWVVGLIGEQILKVFKLSALNKQAMHWSVVVDTFETFICRSILVGAHVCNSSGIPESDKKHVLLLPWWLYLSCCSGVISIVNEVSWSTRMKKSVFFFITDCLVRKSFICRAQCRDFLRDVSQGLLSAPRILSSLSPDFRSHRAGQEQPSPTPEYSIYREGHSINVGANALVSTFFHDLSVSEERKLASPSSRRANASAGESGKSPSPTCPQNGLNKALSSSSVVLSPPIEPSYSGAINPLKRRKLALQFAVKLGNLHATQDVHSLLSFLPSKACTSPRPNTQLEASKHESSDTALTEDDKLRSGAGSKENSLNSSFVVKKEKFSDPSENVTTSTHALEELLFDFLRNLLSLDEHLPIASSFSQQFSLFLAISILSRIFSETSVSCTFGREVQKRVCTQEVFFGFSVGYENRLWPQVLCEFLDSCAMESICAVAKCEPHQTALAKNLVAAVTMFTRQYSKKNLVGSRYKKGLDFMLQRWIPRCNSLVMELRCRDVGASSENPPIRFRVLQHFYLLVFYLHSSFMENISPSNAHEKTFCLSKDIAEAVNSPVQEEDLEKTQHRKNILNNILIEGEEILFVFRRCMSQLPWLKVLRNAPEKEVRNSLVLPMSPPPTSTSLEWCREVQLTPRREAVLKSTEKFQKDIEFLKYCIYYYLTVVDFLIEIAIYTGTTPTYLSETLLRSEHHDVYLTSSGTARTTQKPLPIPEIMEWQRFLNYHCLSVMKDGISLVDMGFISVLRNTELESSTSQQMKRHFFDSVQLDRFVEYIPSPEGEFNDSWHFLRILNHAKLITRYLCSSSISPSKILSHSSAEMGNTIQNSFRREVSRFVDGVTPFLSTSSGIFAQNLSVPHQHPFSSLEQACGKSVNESFLVTSLEEISRDLWLRTQALQLISAASAPITVKVPKDLNTRDEGVFILNGSAAKAYVRLLFLRIVQAVFSHQSRYDERREKFLLSRVSKKCKDLYQQTKSLWASCLILSLQAIQFFSHNHAKARETAINLGIHGVLSRVIDAISASQLKDCKQVAVAHPAPQCHPSDVQLDDTDMLGGSLSSVANAHPEKCEEEKETVTPGSTKNDSPFSFVIPSLNLEGLSPPMYFISSGDTGAALQATLFPGMNPNTAAVQSVPVAHESITSSITPTAVANDPFSLSVPSLHFSEAKISGSAGLNKATPREMEDSLSLGLITPSYLYADAYLLSSAVCCTCSLLVQHSGMLRYESTVSSFLLRKRMHLPEASYHLLYGGDSTWKKHVKDTKNSATLKKFLGWCYSDQRPIRHSSAFRCLRECLSNTGDTSFLNLLESWLDDNTLTYYRHSLNLSTRSNENVAVQLPPEESCDSVSFPSFNSRISDDGSLHSIGVFVLLRLLLPRPQWSSQFDFRHRLGAGGFGTVMAADFRLPSNEEENPLRTSSSSLGPQRGWLQEEKKILSANPAIALKAMPFSQQHDDESGMLPVCHAEVLAMVCLRGHPYIVPVLSFGSSEDGYFIVLPRYEQGTLHDWRLRHYPSGCAALVHLTSPPTIERESDSPSQLFSKYSLLSLVCPLFTQLLEAVVFMHTHHLRHNDIKAENILLDQVHRIPSSCENSKKSNEKTVTEIILPHTIRLCDFGSCDTCTDADLQELVRDVVAGESRFVEGRWGFGNGTEAIQPPEIIVPRWRYELMRAVTLHFVSNQCIREADSKSPLTADVTTTGKSANCEGDISSLFDMLRRIELSADIWSCGCLLYEVLTGVMLFGEGKLGLLTALATSSREQLAEIARGEPRNVLERFQNAMKTSPALNHWDTNDLTDAVGQEVVDFLQELLNVDPLQRPTALEALEKWKALASQLF